MSEWAMLAVGACTALLLGLGLGFTFLEFRRADEGAPEEESGDWSAGARVEARGRAA